MINKIDAVLLREGYQKIPSSLPEFTIYFQEHGSSVIVILLIDFHPGFELTQEQCYHIKEQVRTLFFRRGFADIKLFSLYAASEIEAARTVSTEDFMSWIYDTTHNRILIYEKQAEDFYGLRKLLEQVQEETVMEEQSPVDRLLSHNVQAPVNTAFVLLNIIVFLGLEIFGSTNDLSYMVQKGALFPPSLAANHEYYRLLTCMFMHFGIEHLAFNMLALFFLGEYVERALGKMRYFVLYLLSGLAGSSFSLLFAMLQGNNIVSAGASGAVFGVIGALLCIVIRNHGRLDQITSPKLMLLIGYSIFSGITSEGIDNAAHIGGLIAGLLLAVLLYKKKETSM